MSETATVTQDQAAPPVVPPVQIVAGDTLPPLDGLLYAVYVAKENGVLYVAVRVSGGPNTWRFAPATDVLYLAIWKGEYQLLMREGAPDPQVRSWEVTP